VLLAAGLGVVTRDGGAHVPFQLLQGQMAQGVRRAGPAEAGVEAPLVVQCQASPVGQHGKLGHPERQLTVAVFGGPVCAGEVTPRPQGDDPDIHESHGTESATTAGPAGPTGRPPM
jgi:hypothetical protein